MKAYVSVTATLFGLLAIAHVWRAYVERDSLTRDPWFLLISALAAALCAWGFSLLLAASPKQ